MKEIRKKETATFILFRGQALLEIWMQKVKDWPIKGIFFAIAGPIDKVFGL